MSSQIMWNRSSQLNSGNIQEVREELVYENLNCHQLETAQIQQEKWKNGNNGVAESVVYDVPSSNEFIFTQSKPKDNSVNDLIPSVARLVLNNNQNFNNGNIRNDFLESDDVNDEDDILDFSDGEEVESTDSYIESQQAPYDNGSTSDRASNNNYREFSDNDYGLEVIQEETESQISSSDSESEVDESDSAIGLPSSSHSKKHCKDLKRMEEVEDKFHDQTTKMLIGELSPQLQNDTVDEKDFTTDSESTPKHIRISPNWDPEPILHRLYAIQSPQHLSNKAAKHEPLSGHLSILSGNRKKGTFWNAWKRKFYVLASGKLCGYEKDNCQDLFQTINLIGGKIDFLDPTDFVGTDHSKAMVNRIFGVDDGKGHYYVLQCSSSNDASDWVAALQDEATNAAALHYALPVLPKAPAIFKDIILVDFGSTSIRAGVLTHQPSLPALFFASTVSENENGSLLYGNQVYIRENRKNAKIKFPIECTSKFCQNNLNINAVKGFLVKVFQDLNVQPDQYRIIINLPRRVDSNCKRSILELVFNEFQMKSALLCHQSVVAFWAYSAENGIVCDVGERCDIVPVSQGFVLSHAWGRAPFGGQPLKHALRQGLGPQENGLYLSTPAENLVLRFISENFVYSTVQNSRKLSQGSQEVVVEMDLRDVLSIPNLIGVNQNVLRDVSEGFFEPGLYGLDCDALPKLLFKSLQDCGMDIRKEMSQNIFVAGGCSTIPGFVERLEFELTKLCPPHLKPKIHASPYRYHASYIGASVLSGTDAFEKSLVHRSKYDGGSGPSYWFV